MAFPWNGNYPHGFPFFSWGLVLVWLIVFLVIGYFVYQDANKKGKNGLLWWILVMIPFLGIIILILYMVTREGGSPNAGLENSKAMSILKGRYARGELTSEQFMVMQEDLKKVEKECIWETPEPDNSNALDILTERYVKGELPSEQLKIMCDDLKNLKRDVWQDIELDDTHALDILKERYARGEIQGDQFRIMRENLKH